VTIAAALAPIFLVMAMGALGRAKGWFPPEFIKAASRLAYFAALPCLLFRAMSQAPLHGGLAWQPILAAPLAVLLVWLAGVALAKLLINPTKTHCARRASWVATQAHGNLGIVGIAVIYYALGSEALAGAGAAIAVIVIVQNLLVVISLTKLGTCQYTPPFTWLRVLKNPIIISIVAGLAWAGLGYKMPLALDRCLQVLGNLGLPLALLITGAYLELKGLKGSWLHLGSMTFIKLFAAPLVGWGLLWLMQTPQTPLAATVLALAAPSAAGGMIMAAQLGGDTEFTSAAVSLTNLAALPVYFAWLYVLAV
jgi:predicted permease